MTELQSCPSKGCCHVRSIIDDSTYTFNWTVENFSKYQLGTEIKSPTFRPLPDYAFYAILKINKNVDGYLVFHLISGMPIEVNHHVSIENSAAQVVLEKIQSHTYGDVSKCDVLPSCETAMKKARAENVLIIKCVMEFYGGGKIDTYCHKPHSNQVPSSDNLPVLSRDLKAMYNASLYADVKLRVGDHFVHVHKSIMCARSSVFARMFETPMDEKRENVIIITDLDLPVLKDLVSYLYTGVLANNDFESILALFYAADKYDVSCLRKTCIDILLSELDVENACPVLALADKHSDVDFKNSVMDFIKFHFNKVLETDAWKELVDNTTQLAMELVTSWNKKGKVKS